MAELNASPAAETLADDNDVDIHEVEGSGKDGLITKTDVQKHIDGAASGNGAAAADETIYGDGDKETIQARKDASYYCPGCGKPIEDENAECTGTPEAPHKPIAVVSTDELGGDPEKHTAAPSTEQ